MAARPLLAFGSSGVIVLDLSPSVEHGTIARMYATLTQLAASKGRFGLVVFSNQAYEALPPNTPAAELSSFARFFHPIGLPPAAAAEAMAAGVNLRRAPVESGFAIYPVNPWAYAFSFGTTISAGLILARSVLAGSGASHPNVWLISDLADGPDDLPVVAETVRQYDRLGIALNVIGLDPSKADGRFFAALVGASGRIVEAKPTAEAPLTTKHGFPLGLAVAAGLLALLLGANELRSTPLSWGPPQASRAVGPA